jgi:hypothetical protein
LFVCIDFDFEIPPRARIEPWNFLSLLCCFDFEIPARARVEP